MSAVLASCGTFGASRADPAPILEKQALPKPDPMDLRDVEFTVVRPDRLPSGDSWTLLALPPDEYVDYERNQAEIRRWVREAGAQLDYYTEDEQ